MHSAYYSDRVVSGCNERWCSTPLANVDSPPSRRVFSGIDLRSECHLNKWAHRTYGKTLRACRTNEGKLRCAAKALDLPTIRRLLSAGADANGRVGRSRSALQAVLESLCDAVGRVSPDHCWVGYQFERITDDDELRALRDEGAAYEEIGLKCVRTLLAAGADTEFNYLSSDAGMLQILMASDLTFRTAATCVTLIVDAGVDPHQFIYHGQSTDLTPFEYAMVRRPAFLPTFLSAGVAVPDDVQDTIDNFMTGFEESRMQYTLTEIGRERIRASTEYLESVSAAGGYRLYAAHRRKELIDLLAIILNKRVPQRPLAGIIDYSRVPGARGLELRADRRKEVSFLCIREHYSV